MSISIRVGLQNWPLFTLDLQLHHSHEVYLMILFKQCLEIHQSTIHNLLQLLSTVRYRRVLHKEAIPFPQIESHRPLTASVARVPVFVLPEFRFLDLDNTLLKHTKCRLGHANDESSISLSLANRTASQIHSQLQSSLRPRPTFTTNSNRCAIS